MSIGSKDGTHDISIASDASASPTTNVNLRIAVNPETNTKRWREYRREPFIDRQGIGAVQFADKDPQSDLVFSQKDWSKGAMSPLYKDKDSEKYSSSTGLDMRPEGVVSLGMSSSNVTWSLSNSVDQNFKGAVSVPWNPIINGGAETGSVSPWIKAVDGDSTGSTLTIDTANEYVGDESFRLYHTADAGEGINVSQTLSGADATAVRGATVVFSAAVKPVQANTKLWLSLEDSTDTTNSAEHTATSYGLLSVTKKIASDTTTLVFKVNFENVSGSGGQIAYLDAASARIYDVNGGLVTQLHVAYDKYIGVVNSAGTSIATVHTASDNIRSLIEFEGNLFYTLEGLSQKYSYGSGGEWTEVDSVASIFTKTSSSTLQELWKSVDSAVLAENGVSLTTNATGGSWGTLFKVGSPTTGINNIYSYEGKLLVGKGDGLYHYRKFFNDGSSANDFINITLEYSGNPSSENFAIGTESKGSFYLTAAQQGLFKYGSGSFTDISSLFSAPRANQDFGGDITALINDSSGIWLILNSSTADATATKKVWLLNLEGDIVHTIDNPTISNTPGLAIADNKLYAFGKTYAAGTSNYAPTIYKWNLPEKSKFPSFDLTPSINTTGNFNTSRWDGNLPDVDKAFISCTIFHKANLDANHTIVVKYGVDNAESTTRTLGSADHLTANGTTQTTFYFNDVASPESNSVGKDIQLNITLTTTNGVSPELYGFAVHSMLSPQRVILRDFEVYIGDDIQMYNLASDPTSKKTLIDNLETLEAQVYPVYLTDDLDGDGATTSGRWKILSDSVKKVEEMDDGIEIWGFTMQKVIVA